MSEKASFRAILHEEMDPKARQQEGLSWTNRIIVLLVLASFATFALETEPELSTDWRHGINIFNYAILGIFAVEYILRIWVAGEREEYRGALGRLRYVASPFAIADMLAFLPELLWLLFAPGGIDAEGLLVLRILRLARLLKIARLLPAFDILGAAMKRAGSQLLTTLALALALVYVSAVVLYFIEGSIEGQEAGFGSIPRAIWWAVATLTTVGYGDVYPVTPIGRIAAGVIALAGIGVVALPAGVFASAFTDEIQDRSKRRKKRDDQG